MGVKEKIFVMLVFCSIACGREQSSKTTYAYSTTGNGHEVAVFWVTKDGKRLYKALCNTIDPGQFKNSNSSVCHHRSSAAFAGLKIVFEKYRRSELKTAKTIMANFDQRRLGLFADAPEGKELRKLEGFFQDVKSELDPLLNILEKKVRSVASLESEVELLETQIEKLKTRLESEPNNTLFQNSLQSSSFRLNAQSKNLAGEERGLKNLKEEVAHLRKEADQINTEIEELQTLREQSIELSKKRSKRYQNQVRKIQLLSEMQAAAPHLKQLLTDEEFVYKHNDLPRPEYLLLELYSDSIR